MEVARKYLRPRPAAEIRYKMDVMKGHEPVSEQLVLAHEVWDVRPAVTFAGLAGTLGVQRPEVSPVAGVLEVDAPAGCQGRSVAGETGR